MTSMKTVLDLQSGRLKTGATLGRRDDGTLKPFLTLEHDRPTNAIAARFEGKRWAATYEHPSKDFKVVYTPKSKHGLDWCLRQRLPKGELAMFPSPEVEVKLRGPLHVGSSVRDTLTLNYDYLSRMGLVDEKVTLWDGRCEVKLQANTKTGIQGTDIAAVYKPGKNCARQLGVFYSKAAGSQLSWRGDLTADAQLTTVLDLPKQTVLWNLDVTQSAGTVVTVSGKVGKNTKKCGVPALTLSLKTNF